LIENHGLKILIASMAPTPNNIENFWKIVAQNKVSLIVQLCPEEEKTSKEMCMKY